MRQRLQRYGNDTQKQTKLMDKITKMMKKRKMLLTLLSNRDKT